MSEPIQVFFMADACPLGLADVCPDLAWRAATEIQKENPLVTIQILRASPWEKTYDKLFCKVRTCFSKLYRQYPNKKYYFKIDTDTILLPLRFFQFVNTLMMIAEDVGYPHYFGTITESGSGRLLCGDRPKWAALGPTHKGGLCFGQGGAGYGLNNQAMKLLTSNDTGCSRNTEELWPEDVYTALQLYRTANVTIMHCSGFRSSEVVTSELLSKAITFHYTNTTWLTLSGPQLKQ